MRVIKKVAVKVKLDKLIDSLDPNEVDYIELSSLEFDQVLGALGRVIFRARTHSHLPREFQYRGFTLKELKLTISTATDELDV